jgi:hypothetical protein
VQRRIGAVQRRIGAVQGRIGAVQQRIGAVQRVIGALRRDISAMRGTPAGAWTRSVRRVLSPLEALPRARLMRACTATHSGRATPPLDGL